MIEGFKIDLVPDLDMKLHTMPELADLTMQAAEQVAGIARSTAPVATGLYASSIEVQKTKTGARVFAADQKSAWIEFGVPGRNQPARFVLRNAAEAAGLSFKKGGA